MAIEFAQGKFWCRVVGQGLSVAKSGNEQFWIQVEPIGQINNADPEGDLLNCPVGKTRTIYRAITANTIEWVKQDLKYLCTRSGKPAAIGGFEFLDPNTPGFVDFTNAEIEVMCDHDEYEGKKREKWIVISGTGGAAKPLEEKSVRKLNAMFGKELKSLGGDEPKKPASRAVAPKKETATVPVRDESENTVPADDIPF